MSTTYFDARRRQFRSGAAVCVALAAVGVISLIVPGPRRVRRRHHHGVGLGRAATGCTVPLAATVAGSSALGLGSHIPPVEFWDNATFLGSVTPTVHKATPTTGVSMTADIDWKPTTTGSHPVRAEYVGGNYTPESEGSATVNVGTGLDLGSGCLPIG
ncbi:hypothetical protein [Nocardia sp. NPDC050710]|uniref:hypothetical protein n=1 Tax=Nocardia sp. NPDC050710 TaxID=3157220 RepID=UPI0033DD1A5F